MKLSLDNDGNFLFDGEICTDDRIDDIRNWINTANEAYAAVNDFCERCESGEFRSVKTYGRFKAILEKVNYNEGTANCIDNPPIATAHDILSVALTNYHEGEQIKTYWYDSQGNAHQY